eukprot:7399154-Ditylum_brightwellii.AAC.1
MSSHTYCRNTEFSGRYSNNDNDKAKAKELMRHIFSIVGASRLNNILEKVLLPISYLEQTKHIKGSIIEACKAKSLVQ